MPGPCSTSSRYSPLQGINWKALDKLKADLEGRLKPLADSGHLAVKIACSQVPEQLRKEWEAQVREYFHLDYEVEDADLTLSVACHTGPGVLGVGAVRV